MDEAEADAEAVAKAFKNMPDDIKELVASNMDKVPKNGQVSAEWFHFTAGTLMMVIFFCTGYRAPLPRRCSVEPVPRPGEARRLLHPSQRELVRQLPREPLCLVR